MSYLPASHGAIVTGMLPLATAGWIAWQHHERPSKQFWFAALVGSLTVIIMFLQGNCKIVLADFMLLACLLADGLRGRW